jgi:hypothetical protein
VYEPRHALLASPPHHQGALTGAIRLARGVAGLTIDVRSDGPEQRAAEKKAEVADAPALHAEGRKPAADTEEQPQSFAAASSAPEVPAAVDGPGGSQQRHPSTGAVLALESGTTVLEPVAGEPSAANGHASTAGAHERDEGLASQPSDPAPMTTPRGSYTAHLEALSDDEDDSAAQMPAASDISDAGFVEMAEATSAAGDSVTAASGAAVGGCGFPIDSSESGKSKAADSEYRDEGYEGAHADDGEEAEEQAPTGPAISKEEILMKIQVFNSCLP